ncbi:MAG: class I SAM-dependent methyltransferase [Acholeplasmataceae bacterium]|nr:class I SAM-dependent methyltransferase [Acholeplasmataceae bacterium]
MRSLICDLSHDIIKPYISKDDIMVDATMGNGFDTLFLASLSKHVYAFDIQEQALSETKKLLEKSKIQNVTLIKDSHENIFDYVHDFKGVFFNLGYLPKGDKSITTKVESTLKTFDQIIQRLNVDGFILYVIYPGHEEGNKESIALNEKMKTLDPKIFKIIRIDLPFQNNQPPYILWVIKQKSDQH